MDRHCMACMGSSCHSWLVFVVLLTALARLAAQPGDTDLLPPLPFDSIQLPPGFTIEPYTRYSVPSARQLALSQGTDPDFPEAHIVYVGSEAGNVYALVDWDGTGNNVTVQIILSQLFRPQGVAWRNHRLYVAEPGRILAYDSIDSFALGGQALPGGTVTPPAGTVISAAFPALQPVHADHFIAFGPDDRLYVPQGSPGNTGPCGPIDANLSTCTINSMKLDGTDLQPYATGIRHTVGFDWDPDTGALWAAVNGRDLLNPDQDNRPDDYLAYLPRAGLDFGFEFCHRLGRGNPEDRDVGPGVPLIDDVNSPPGINASVDTKGFQQYCHNPANAYPPSQTLGPHVASLGITFYSGAMFPEAYRRSIFIAEHGSWDRTSYIGYRVVNLGVHPNGTTFRHDLFASGWLQDAAAQRYFGRPVDVLELYDGSLLVSDDFADAVWRISYEA